MELEYSENESLPSDELEKLSLHSLPNRLLMLFKMRGPQTAAAIGAEIGTTKENARQQLVKLAADGLVEAKSVPQGVGRPQQIWTLTERGHAQFPDTHAELTVSILNSVRKILGGEALDQLIAARETETRAAYARILSPVDGIEARLAALAERRTREGYMAEWRPAEDGVGWLLIENHCPICAAATACQGFCRAELAIFRTVLGPDYTVEREEHILRGARRCTYRIVPVRSTSTPVSGSKPKRNSTRRDRD